jgi:hypothetical protein
VPVEKDNIVISSMPTKVHDEQCLSSAHSLISYNSGKHQLTIEKFIRISSHQMSTSSSSLAAFIAWTPFDTLHQCFSCTSCGVSKKENLTGQIDKIEEL